jgi:hypothetical protein
MSRGVYNLKSDCAKRDDGSVGLLLYLEVIDAVLGVWAHDDRCVELGVTCKEVSVVVGQDECRKLGFAGGEVLVESFGVVGRVDEDNVAI